MGEEKGRMDFIMFLRECFSHADTDGNGVLDSKEFAALIDNEAVTTKIRELGVTLPTEELRLAFNMLDVDEDGELTIDEFIHGLALLQQTLNTKHVVLLDYNLQRMQVQLVHKFQTIDTAMSASHKKNENILRSLDELHTHMVTLTGSVSDQNENVKKIRADIKRLSVAKVSSRQRSGASNTNREPHYREPHQ